MDTSSLDLFYLDQNSASDRPSARVGLKGKPRRKQSKTDVVEALTFNCTSMVEFDAEIRRLHAELEELRARAKKKFYRAQSAAAGS